MAKLLSATATVLIDRRVEDVFGFFADFEHDVAWRPQVKSIRRRGDVGSGAVYEQTVTGPGGRRVSADVRVVAFEPEHRIAFEGISGPVRPRGEYRFEVVEAGTRVTFDLTAELSAGKALVMGGAVKNSMEAEVSGLSRAKELLEEP